MDLKAKSSEGTLYSGSSMMKKDLRRLRPVIRLTSSAPTKIRAMPMKYISGATQGLSPKNAPANRAMTGSFAPQGMKGASIAVARRSRSSRMVRAAMTPGMAQPVVITKGITDLPERPTFLKIGSSTTVARAM